MGTPTMDVPTPGVADAPPLRRFTHPRQTAAAGERRFARAFESRLFPVLRYSRDRALELLDAHKPDLAAVVAVVESDPGLCLAVLGAANRSSRRGKRGIASISQAVGVLDPDELRMVTVAMPTFGLLGDGVRPNPRAEEFRLHALATQHLAAQLRARTGIGSREELVVSSLLHDIGKLPLLDAHARYEQLASLPGTPEQRLALERRHIGLDHATAGSLVARRLGLPRRLSAVIERHHADDARGDAGVIRF